MGGGLTWAEKPLQSMAGEGNDGEEVVEDVASDAQEEEEDENDVAVEDAEAA